jgi:hypothetical protein
VRRLDDKMAVFHDVSHQCSFQFHGRDVREDDGRGLSQGPSNERQSLPQ